MNKTIKLSILLIIIINCLSCISIKFKPEVIYIKVSGTYTSSIGNTGNYIFEYDDEYNLIKEELKILDSFTHIKLNFYDENGIKIRSELYLEDSEKADFYIIYKYDENNRLIKEVYYNSENDELNETTYYFYDKENRINKAYTEIPDKFRSNIYIKYDEYGNIIEYKYEPPFNWNFIETYEYIKVEK